MRLGALISFVFILTIQVNFGQIQPFTEFKSNLSNVESDSAFKLIDQRLYDLESHEVDNLLKVETLKLKSELADSLHDRMMSHYAISELLEYRAYITPEEYYKYLYKEGNNQINIGGVDVAMSFHFRAVSIADSLSNDTLLAEVSKRIGINYLKSKNYDLSFKYLNQSLDIYQTLQDSIGMANSNMSLGNCFKNQGIFDTAMVYYNKSINLSEQIGYERGMAGNYNNIGNVFRYQNKLDQSLEYYFLALEMNKKTGNQLWESYNYNNIGLVYKIRKEYNKAFEYYQKSMFLKDEMGDSYGKMATIQNISEIYALKKDYKNAYIYLKDFNKLRDSIASQDKLNLTAELEAKFQNEKKEVEINKLRVEQSLKDAVIDGQNKDLEYQKELRNKEKILLYAFGFILITLVFTVFVFWKNSKERKKYVDEIDKAKLRLTQKNKEVTDSINYAKRIQAAILPSTSILKSYLKESFVLYIPKDIVAGDFYWTEKVGDTVLFAVADCTGHGVPGAMVSVVCNNALNNTIKQNHITDPGKILDKTTDLVLKQFETSEDGIVRDGMDIALCSFDLKTRKLRYSGANTPLWIVRNDEVIEVKATRQPVGKYSKRINFVTHNVEVQENDMLYMSSDGFADQFGGSKGKKFMKKHFKELLVQVSKSPLNQQSQELHNAFETWRDSYEQVDDICVMGIKINDN